MDAVRAQVPRGPGRHDRLCRTRECGEGARAEVSARYVAHGDATFSRVPGERKRDTDLGLARDRQLDDASRVNPTCVDLGATRADHRGEKARACRVALGPGSRSRVNLCLIAEEGRSLGRGTLGSCGAR